jgi:hypothetical protein
MHNSGRSDRFIGGEFARQEVAATQTAKELLLRDAEAAKSVLELMQCLHRAFYVPPQLNIPIFLTVEEFNAIRERLPEPAEAERAKIRELLPEIERAFVVRAPFFGLNPETFYLYNKIMNPAPSPFQR